MLDGLKRLFSHGPAAPRRKDIESWAEQRHFGYRPARDADGFVVEGHFGAVPWRLEWGTSQRPYVIGNELRLRADVATPGDVQLMLLDRPLQDAMEKAIFEQYVEGVQTRIDNQTPPEMRWLVMFPKLTPQELGALRERFSAVAAAKGWLQRWLEGDLSDALLAAPLADDRPFVLMIARGRVTLRTALDSPQAQTLDAWLRLYEVALREAQRAESQRGDSVVPSGVPSQWSSTGLSGDGNTKL